MKMDFLILWHIYPTYMSFPQPLLNKTRKDNLYEHHSLEIHISTAVGAKQNVS